MDGYRTLKPCAYCGMVKNNALEPRFWYAVCEDHQDIPPAYLTQDNNV